MRTSKVKHLISTKKVVKRKNGVKNDDDARDRVVARKSLRADVGGTIDTMTEDDVSQMRKPGRRASHPMLAFPAIFAIILVEPSPIMPPTATPKYSLLRILCVWSLATAAKTSFLLSLLLEEG